MKMEKQKRKILIFDIHSINKNVSHKSKGPINIDKIVIPKRGLYGKKKSFKYFIEYISETNAFTIR